MSADDASDGENTVDSDGTGGVETDGSPEVRDRLEQFDDGLVDLLSWVLETETRARIYVQLRQHPDSTSEELAEKTGLYPSTVREALAELHDEGRITRDKRQSDGAGNNPYEYSAIPPSDLVSGMVDDVQRQLNTVFNMDQYLDGDSETDDEPVTIDVTEELDDE